jgi:CBS domain containing-hemolysin-like protein
MMYGWFFAILMPLVYLAGSALFSGLETGGYLVNRLRLRHRARTGDRSARRLRRGLGDAHRFIFTVLIGNNIAIYLLSRDVTLFLQNGMQENGMLFGMIPLSAETAATLILLVPLFIFGELLPKNWFHRHADSLMYRCSRPLLFFEWLFFPVIFLLTRLSALLAGREQDQRIFDGVSVSLRGLQEYFSGEMCADLLSAHQHGMINNLVALSRVPVRDLMMPIAEATCLSDLSTVAQVLDVMNRRSCEQVVMYGRGTRQVVGYVTLFDLMDPAVSPSAPAKEYMRKVIHLSSGLSANRVLRRLRQNPAAPAVIQDRSSKAVGLLYLRDIAAHIVS